MAIGQSGHLRNAAHSHALDAPGCDHRSAPQGGRLPPREAAAHTRFICLQPSTSALLPEGHLPALHADSGELEPPPPLP